jgi:hypothetical protein
MRNSWGAPSKGWPTFRDGKVLHEPAEPVEAEVGDEVLENDIAAVETGPVDRSPPKD